MRVVHVYRKPFQGAALEIVAAQGTGALNIERSRTGFQESGASEAPGGRWPANLVLVHQPACQVVGRDRVRTGTAVRERSGRTIFSGRRRPPLPNLGYGEGGYESVRVWTCGPGCPAASLGGQVGRFFVQLGAEALKAQSGPGRDNVGPLREVKAALGCRSMVTLDAPSREALENIQGRTGCSKSYAICAALVFLDFVSREQLAGALVVLRRGSVSHVVDNVMTLAPAGRRSTWLRFVVLGVVAYGLQSWDPVYAWAFLGGVLFRAVVFD